MSSAPLSSIRAPSRGFAREKPVQELRGPEVIRAISEEEPFLAALKRDGVMTLVGVPSEPHPSPSVFGLIMKRRSLAGSMIGGIAETQEMLDFCAEKGIGAEIEVIPIQEINTAFDRMLNGKVKYRFVIDMQSLKDEAAKAA